MVHIAIRLGDELYRIENEADRQAKRDELHAAFSPIGHGVFVSNGFEDWVIVESVKSVNAQTYQNALEAIRDCILHPRQ
jgi:hypothetical protein